MLVLHGEDFPEDSSGKSSKGCSTERIFLLHFPRIFPRKRRTERTRLIQWSMLHGEDFHEDSLGKSSCIFAFAQCAKTTTFRRKTRQQKKNPLRGAYFAAFPTSFLTTSLQRCNKNFWCFIFFIFRQPRRGKLT